MQFVVSSHLSNYQTPFSYCGIFPVTTVQLTKLPIVLQEVAFISNNDINKTKLICLCYSRAVSDAKNFDLKYESPMKNMRNSIT